MTRPRLSTATPLSINDVTYYLVTDGSGHVDKFGGWAAELRNPRSDADCHFLCGASAGTGEVYRMEFTALLEALTFLFNHANYWGNNALSMLARNPMTIEWYNDNEALVNSVRRDPVSLQPLSRRDTYRDLWARFEWFEQYIRFNAIHLPRETPEMKMVDWYASSCREMIKGFTGANTYSTVLESMVKVEREKIEQSNSDVSDA